MTSSKALSDAQKLARALRDMLFRLHERVNHEKGAERELQVVGVVTAGVGMQVLRMGCWGGGGVAVLMREKGMEVPVGVDVRRLCKVVAHVQRVVGVVEECVGLVEGSAEGSAEDAEREMIRELMFGEEERGVVEGGLVRAPDTP